MSLNILENYALAQNYAPVTDEEEEERLRRARQAGAADSPFTSSLYSSLVGGVGNVATTVGNIAGANGLRGLSSGAYDIGEALADEARSYATPSMDYRSVKDLSSGWDFVKSATGQGVGSMLPIIGAGLFGGAPAGLAASFGMSHGENINRLRDDAALQGMSDRDMLGQALPYSAVQAGADYLVPGGVINKAVTAPFKSVPARAGAALLGSAATEGLTEVGQEFLGQQMHSAANPYRDTSEDSHALINAGLSGFLGGGAVGGSMAAASELANSVPTDAPGLASVVDRVKRGMQETPTEADRVNNRIEVLERAQQMQQPVVDTSTPEAFAASEQRNQVDTVAAAEEVAPNLDITDEERSKLVERAKAATTHDQQKVVRAEIVEQANHQRDKDRLSKTADELSPVDALLGELDAYANSVTRHSKQRALSQDAQDLLQQFNYLGIKDRNVTAPIIAALEKQDAKGFELELNKLVGNGMFAAQGDQEAIVAALKEYAPVVPEAEMEHAPPEVRRAKKHKDKLHDDISRYVAEAVAGTRDDTLATRNDLHRAFFGIIEGIANGTTDSGRVEQFRLQVEGILGDRGAALFDTLMERGSLNQSEDIAKRFVDVRSRDASAKLMEGLDSLRQDAGGTTAKDRQAVLNRLVHAYLDDRTGAYGNAFAEVQQRIAKAIEEEDFARASALRKQFIERSKEGSELHTMLRQHFSGNEGAAESLLEAYVNERRLLIARNGAVQGAGTGRVYENGRFDENDHEFRQNLADKNPDDLEEKQVNSLENETGTQGESVLLDTKHFGIDEDVPFEGQRSVPGQQTIEADGATGQELLGKINADAGQGFNVGRKSRLEQALDTVNQTYSGARVEPVSVFAWAESKNAHIQDEGEREQAVIALLNRSAQALINNDAKRAVELQKDLKSSIPEVRREAAEQLNQITRRRELYDEVNGRGVDFYSSRMNSHFRFAQASPPTHEILSTPEREVRKFTVDDQFAWENSQVDSAGPHVRTTAQINEFTNTLRNSLLPVTMNGKQTKIDIAGNVAAMMGHNQAGDITGVGEVAQKNINTDSTGAEYNTKDGTSMMFLSGVKAAFSNVMASLMINQALSAERGEMFNTHDYLQNGERGFSPNLVIYRDNATGRTVTYGQAFGLQGENASKAVHAKATKARMDKAELALAIPTATPSEQHTQAILRGEAVSGMDTQAAKIAGTTAEVAAENAAVNERFVAERVLKRDGVLHNLNAQALIKIMATRHGMDADAVMNRSDDSAGISRELAAALFKEGLQLLKRSGYELTTSLDSTRGNELARLALWDTTYADGETYTVTLGSLLPWVNKTHKTTEDGTPIRHNGELVPYKYEGTYDIESDKLQKATESVNSQVDQLRNMLDAIKKARDKIKQGVDVVASKSQMNQLIEKVKEKRESIEKALARQHELIVNEFSPDGVTNISDGAAKERKREDNTLFGRSANEALVTDTQTPYAGWGAKRDTSELAPPTSGALQDSAGRGVAAMQRKGVSQASIEATQAGAAARVQELAANERDAQVAAEAQQASATADTARRSAAWNAANPGAQPGIALGRNQQIPAQPNVTPPPTLANAVGETTKPGYTPGDANLQPSMTVQNTELPKPKNALRSDGTVMGPTSPDARAAILSAQAAVNEQAKQERGAAWSPEQSGQTQVPEVSVQEAVAFVATLDRKDFAKVLPKLINDMRLSSKPITQQFRELSAHIRSLHGNDPDSWPVGVRNLYNRMKSAAEADTPFNKQTPGGNVENNWGKVQDDLKRRLGKLADALISHTLGGYSGRVTLPTEGTFRATIEIAANADWDVTNAHENWHVVEALLKEMGEAGQQILNTIYKATSRPEVHDWLTKQLIEDGEVAGHSDALEQLNEPSERAAFAFQYFIKNGGQLPITPRGRSVLTRLWEFLKGMLGVSSDLARTGRFFEFFDSGAFLKNHENPQAVLDSLLATASDKFFNKVGKALKPVRDIAFAAFGHAADRIRAMNIGSYTMLLEGVQNGYEGYAGLLKEQNANTYRLFNEFSKFDPTDEKAVSDFVRRVEQYKQEAWKLWSANAPKGKPLPKEAVFDEGQSSLPTVVDLEALEGRVEAFRADLKRYGGAIFKEADINNLINRILTDGHAALPRNAFRNHPEVAAKYATTDTTKAAFAYIRESVQQAEQAKAFPGTSIQELLEEGDKHATEHQRSLIRTFVGAVDGSASSNMNPYVRKLFGTIITGINLSMLPFAVFSQMIEPLQLAYRSNSLTNATDSFFRGVRDLPRTFQAINKSYKKDYWETMASDLGLIADANVVSIMSQLMSDVPLTGKLDKINKAFFRYNFMEQWNRSMHVASTQNAVRMIQHYTENPSAEGDKLLLELGLRRSDVKFVAHDMPTADGGTRTEQMPDATQPKVRAAIIKMVAESMAHPDPTTNTMWMNDPRYALLAHLKRFTFAFAYYINRRMLRDVKDANYAALAPMAFAVPWVLTVDVFKHAITPLEATYRNDWGVGDYMLHGVDRASLLGRYGIAKGFFDNVNYGGTGLESFSPAGEIAGKIARGVEDGNGWETFFKQLPGNQLVTA